MADSRPEGRTLVPLGAGRATAEGVVHQIMNGVARELDVNAVVGQVDIDELDLAGPLARKENAIVLGAVLERFDDLALAGPVEWGRSNKHTSLRHLPVTFWAR
ncbi:MAG TPA: hypothetical protein PKA98_00585 [Acidimicrobiales bacterium]|nr:hypothetical protein [Acidimicrobiales bacterium]